jgi:hypothetical protein
MKPIEPGSPRGKSRIGAQVGLVASALLMFASGWMVVKATEWWQIVGLTVLAGVSGLVASAFARQAR